jgi:Ca2+/Na+ antiporter
VKRNSTFIITACATGLALFADIVVVHLAYRDATVSVAWGRVVAAISIQLAVGTFLFVWLRLRRSQLSAQENEYADVSYRARIPVTAIGITAVLTLLSLDLLYTAFACPGTTIPSTRGHAICST